MAERPTGDGQTGREAERQRGRETKRYVLYHLVRVDFAAVMCIQQRKDRLAKPQQRQAQPCTYVRDPYHRTGRKYTGHFGYDP